MKDSQKIQEFNPIEFIEKIVSFSPRQYIGEIKTADFIEDFLQKRSIHFHVQKFKTKVPIEKEAFLKADGKVINCKSVSLVSGKIDTKRNITSSFEADEYIKIPTITFNPYCEGISCGVFFYNAPAVSISRNDVARILKAKNINGFVKVKPMSYVARNILVGNTKNPKFICFAHYDSILTGTWDNAGGVATIMGNILLYPQVLKNTLYVFMANEELSYDKPAYWCRGFRCFERAYLPLLNGAKKIIVIDGVGITPSYWMTEYVHFRSTILIKNLEKFQSKILRLGASTSKVAKEIYHSELDVSEGIKKEYILQTIKMLHEKIRS